MTTIATQKGLDAQGFHCAACEAPVGISEPNDCFIRVFYQCVYISHLQVGMHLPVYIM